MTRIRGGKALLLLAVLALTIFSGVATLLAGNDQPDASFWDPWSIWFVLRLVAVVLLAAIAFWTAYSDVVSKAELKRAEADRDLTLACQQAAAYIAQQCADVAVHELAAQIWLIDGRAKPARLVRRHRFLLAQGRPGSGVRWEKGKGVVGISWRDRKSQGIELADLYELWRASTAEVFDALPADQRWGLTYAEVDATQDYTGIVVVPLYSTTKEEQMLALFALDYRGAGGFDCVKRVSKDAAFGGILFGCRGLLTSSYADWRSDGDR
jgi:hypothetical protein